MRAQSLKAVGKRYALWGDFELLALGGYPRGDEQFALLAGQARDDALREHAPALPVVGTHRRQGQDRHAAAAALARGERQRLPVMLGGTSNHFWRTALVKAGGWDAWNVTEDADLGLRLAREGLTVGMIAPPTLEAPPEGLLVWINQRSRWLKGFLQTWLVVMRRPGAAVREMAVRRLAVLTPEERAVVARAKAFAEEHVAPNAARWEWERRSRLG